MIHDHGIEVLLKNLKEKKKKNNHVMEGLLLVLKLGLTWSMRLTFYLVLGWISMARISFLSFLLYLLPFLILTEF